MQPLFGAVCLLLALTTLLYGAKDGKRRGSRGDGDYSAPAITVKGDAAGGGAGEGSTVGGKPGAASTGGEISLSVQGSVLLALANNSSLAVEALNVPIQRTFELEERGAYDPTLTGDLAYASGSGAAGADGLQGVSAAAGISVPFTTGTELEGVMRGSTGDQSSLGFLFGVSQELLKGGSRAANLVSIRQAELDSFASEYELRGFTEALVASVETAYWDLLLVEREVGIYTESVRRADQALREGQDQVEVGTLAAIELVPVRAELAFEREALLDAEKRREGARLRLIYLTNPPIKNLWEQRIVPIDSPEIPEGGIGDLESHLAGALRMRSDLNQAVLSLKRGELEVVKTRNGLLPRLDLFISLGMTGYADSFSGASKGLADEGAVLGAGFNFSYPLGNREARAQDERARLATRQSELAIENLIRLVQLDVRSAYVAASRSREQIDAAIETLSLQEEKLKAEAAKFEAGRSSALLVSQAYRDLLFSRISVERAYIEHLKSLIGLYRLDGSLLLRRGVVAPGEEPAEGVIDTLNWK